MPVGRVLATAAVMLLALQGCTTASGSSGGMQRTAMDRAIGECAASVAAGAVLGAVIGGITGGNRGAGRGALIGGAVGVGRCAVLMQMAAAEDRQRLRAAERAAIAANASQTTSIRTKSGKNASIRTQVTPASAPASKALTYTTCRYAEQSVTLDGQTASGGRQLWCRADTGDWTAIAQ